jgi:hypothetical protein
MIERPGLTAVPPARGPLPAETPKTPGAKVGGLSGADRTRSETAGDGRSLGGMARHAAAAAAPCDPDGPTGPPPAFDANLMEAEKQRRLDMAYRFEPPEPAFDLRR